MWEKINNFLKGQIVTSIIYVALGACLAFMPVNMINVICKFIFGILLILVGCYHILLYILEKLNATILDLCLLYTSDSSSILRQKDTSIPVCRTPQMML